MYLLHQNSSAQHAIQDLTSLQVDNAQLSAMMASMLFYIIILLYVSLAITAAKNVMVEIILNAWNVRLTTFLLNTILVKKKKNL